MTTRYDILGRRIVAHFYDILDSWGRHGPLGDWARQAACRGHNPELFFPTETGRGQWIRHNPNTTKARTICAGCPVKTQCLTHAMKNHETGIWGGTTDAEREELRRKSHQ